MFQTKVVQKIKTHLLHSITFSPHHPTVYEIMWKNTVERGKPQMAIWRMRILCRLSKATNQHTEYVVLIAFSLQQWLHDRDSSVGIATRYGLDGPGIESRWGARFSVSVQTGPGAQPASCTVGIGPFPGVKRPGRVVDHPLHLAPRLKKD